MMVHGELAMTSGSPAAVSKPAMPESDEFELDTRFGRITVSRQRAIHFPNGLLGMPDAVEFALTTFPSPNMAQFTMLQSLQDPSLSFITLPIALENPIIAAEDLTQAARDLHIPLDHFATLLIVTVTRENGVAKLSVNARAPVLIDVTTRAAGQFVFPHMKYAIRHGVTL